MLDTRIHYVIPHPQQDLREASHFQGFLPGLLDTAWILEKILVLPISYLELLVPVQETLYRRMHGYGYSIGPLDIRFLNQFPLSKKQPFLCIFSYDKTLDAVSEFVADTDWPILHVSTIKAAKSVHLEKLNRGMLDAYCTKVVRLLAKTAPTEEVAKWASWSKEARPKWNRGRAALHPRRHNITNPNLLVLQSIGYDLRRGEPLFSRELDEYATSVLQLCDEINREREQVKRRGSRFPFHPPEATGAVLSAPSVYRQVYFEKELWESFEGKVPKRFVHFVRRFIVQQESYNVLATRDLLDGLKDNEYAQAMIHVRQQELIAHTIASSAIACSSIAPVIRLPNGVNRIYPDLKRLADCARGHSPHRAVKMRRIARQLIDRLNVTIPRGYIERLSGPRQILKVLSDVPLEWLRIEHLPLMLRHDVCRIPTTPGALFFGEALLNDDHVVHEGEFDEILVVRSFKNTDRLRDVLESALVAVQNEEASRIRIRLVDVGSEQQFIDALNSFDGALMIYDGHGISKGQNDIAGLAIGDEIVDVWNFRGKARIPPIVLLSACDTHPLDGSHASTANGFITSGARTVLATLLPVRADDSARFLGRFLYRLIDYLPLALDSGSGVRWISFVAGMQRMVYVTEVLRAMSNHYPRPNIDELSGRIQLELNIAINAKNQDWYPLLLDRIGTLLGVPIEELQRIVDQDVFLPESLKYVQIGNADRLVITRRSGAQSEGV